MKRLLFCSLLLGASPAFAAPGTGISFLARLPGPPTSACELKGEGREAYLKAIRDVQQDIDAALAERRKAQDAHVKQNEARWKQVLGDQAIKQAGLTDAQAARVRSGQRMTREEKQQLADQVLQQRTNISLAEARNLKNMTPEARKAWAQAYAAEAMAVQQAKPPEEKAADQKEQDRLMRLAKLTQEQQDFLKRNNAEADVVRQKMIKLDQDAQDAYALKIKPIEDNLARTREEASQAEKAEEHERSKALYDQCEEIEQQRTDALKQYCQDFTPAYCELVAKYVAWAKRAQDGFVRYEEMENEKFKLQVNSPDAVLLESTGTLGIQEADSAAKLLASVFKYRLFTDADAAAARETGAAP